MAYEIINGVILTEKQRCNADNCTRPAVSRGLCDKHYRRARKLGDPNIETRPMVYGDEIERFHQKYIPEPNSGCWIWIGGTRANGSGNLYSRHSRNDGISINGHRFSQIIHKGPIPDNLYVCHTCDNTLCVNPDHLFLGTQQDNMTDMKDKNRSNKSRGQDKIGLAKLTNKDAEKIRKDSTHSQSELGRIFNVAQTTIHRIKSGKSY